MNVHRVKLIYYSPTGTTEKVIKSICKGIGLEYEIINFTHPETESKSVELKSTDLAIFAAPVYSGRIAPTAVRRFNNVIGQDTPSVTVVVYGNRAFEDALLELNHLLEKNGLRNIASGVFIGEHSFDSPETPIATGRPDSNDLVKASEFGALVKSKLENLTVFKPVIIPGNYPYREGGRTGGRCPETNTQTCTLCGTCSEVCPVSSIKVKQSVKTDINTCTACSACIKNCPTGARYWDHEGVLKAAKWLSTDYTIQKEPEYYL
jgi:ferredoxin